MMMSRMKAGSMEKVEPGQAPGAKDRQRLKLVFVVMEKTERSRLGRTGYFEM